MESSSGIDRRKRLHALKQRVDASNLSTVCDKRELEIPLQRVGVNVLKAGVLIVRDWWEDLTQTANEP
jgi:hypothetical protein